MFEIFTDQEMICGDRIDCGSDVLVLGSNCPQVNNPCNASNPTPIEISIWGE
jgi:uncharacterized protein YcgI (DUF1989 family)